MKKNKYRDWTDNQLDSLNELYGSISIVDLSKKLNKSISSIYFILNKENINLKLSFWTSKELYILVEDYHKTSNKDLRKILHRSEDAIQLKAISMNLTKDTSWTTLEEEELRSSKLAGMTYSYISDTLNHSELSIHNKLIEMKLIKNIRRWSPDELITIKLMALSGQFTYMDIALKIQCTTEQIYAVCSYRKWGDRIVRSISNGEILLKNILEIIYPNLTIKTQFLIGDRLKLDIFIPEINLGFEYDGIQHFILTPIFHKSQDDLDYIKMLDKKKDTKCEELGIQLIRIRYDDNLDSSLIKELTKNLIPTKESKVLFLAKINNGVFSKSSLDYKKFLENKKEKEKEKRNEYLASDKHKKQLDRAREYRKEAYKKAKEFKDGK